MQGRELELWSQPEQSVLSPLPSSCLTSDPLGAFAVWPLAHYLMSLSFLCFTCEMGRLSPASALLEGLSERCRGSTRRSARHGPALLPAEVQCSSHAAACWSLGFNMSTGARGKASLRGQCSEEAVPAFACPLCSRKALLSPDPPQGHSFPAFIESSAAWKR